MSSTPEQQDGPPWSFPPAFDAKNLVIAGRKTKNAYAVRRIYSVAHNFDLAAEEAGITPATPDAQPVFFRKPPENARAAGESFALPADGAVFASVEPVIAMGMISTGAPAGEMFERIFGFATGIALTRFTPTARAGTELYDWDTAMEADVASICGEVVTTTDLDALPRDGVVTLTVNGELRQTADLSDMIWPLHELAASLNDTLTLYTGDIVFAGTPGGTVAVSPGDVLEAEIEGVGAAKVTLTGA